MNVKAARTRTERRQKVSWNNSVRNYLPGSFFFFEKKEQESEQAKKLTAERAQMLSRYLLFDRVAGYAFFTELQGTIL